MRKEKTDVLIIGAGPAGTVAAAYLAQKGIKVSIVEKSEFPRYTIGESLIPHCMENFKEAGLLDTLQEQNYQIKKGAKFIRNNTAGIVDFAEKFGEGWNYTWQVPRDHFDMVLAEACQQKGVKIHYNTRVKNVKFLADANSITEVESENKTKSIEASFVIDASGFGRVLAKQLDLEAPVNLAQHSSIFTQVNDVLRPKGEKGTQITFEILEREVWFWYIPFSNGNTSIGFVGPNKWFSQFSNNLETAFREMLSRSKNFKEQFIEQAFLFTPQKVNNMAKNVSKTYGKGFVITGNSAKFLDPIFSSGVAFATESSLRAAKLILKELQNEKVDWQKDYEDYMDRGTSVFESYVREWYNGNLQKLILHQNPNNQIKQQVCAVLAGYVWDDTNPFVRKHTSIIKNVANLIRLEEN